MPPDSILISRELPRRVDVTEAIRGHSRDFRIIAVLNATEAIRGHSRPFERFF